MILSRENLAMEFEWFHHPTAVVCDFGRRDISPSCTVTYPVLVSSVLEKLTTNQQHGGQPTVTGSPSSDTFDHYYCIRSEFSANCRNEKEDGFEN